MSIRKRVEDALLLYKNGRHEGAFLTALVAVAATARREDPDRKMADRECFETFLDKRRRDILQVEFRGELHTIPHIFYKWFRCELVHEGGLPIDVEFIESEELSLRAGGAPNYILKISYGWFHWLIAAVVEASCNKEEFAKKLSERGHR
jgi:hypothetical protein